MEGALAGAREAQIELRDPAMQELRAAMGLPPDLTPEEVSEVVQMDDGMRRPDGVTE